MSVAKALRLDPGLHTLRFLSSLSVEERQTKINEPDELGDTPLHVAAAKQLKLAVQFLVQHGANLNAANEAGSTPLHKAAAGGGKEVFKFLLDKCEWVQNHSGLTPFDLASEIFRIDIDIFKKLLAKESDTVTENLTIPADSLAFICGKANLNLARIRAEAFTLIDFEKFDKKDGEKERTITLTARNKEDLDEAKRMITGTLKFKEEIDKEKEKQKAATKKPDTKEKQSSDAQKDTKGPKTSEPADFKTFSKFIAYKADFEKLLPALNAQLAVQTDAKQNAPPGTAKSLPPGASKQLNSNKTVVPPKVEKKTVVKDIEERNNVKIVLPAKNKEESISVTGEPNNVQNAIKEINALRPEKENKMTDRKLFVAKQNHRYVIGKKGANIDRIRKEIGVSVIVPNADSPDEEIILRGAPADIEIAKVDIVNLLRTLTSGPRPDFASRGQGRGPFEDGGRGGRGGRGPRGGRNKPAFGEGEGGERVYRRVDGGGDKAMTLGDWAPQDTQPRNDTAPSPQQQEPNESAQNNNQNQNQNQQRNNNQPNYQRQPRSQNNNQNQYQQRNNNQQTRQNNNPSIKSKLNLTDTDAFPSL